MNWSIDEYGKIPFSQIVFHLKVPLSGTSNDIIDEFIDGFMKDSLAVLIIALVILIVISIINIKNKKEYVLKITKKKKNKTIVKTYRLFKIVKVVTALFVVINLIYDICFVYTELGIHDYIKDLRNPTTLYEQYYVDTAKTKITFPEKKKNLIYIFVESMEATYSSKEYHGAFNYNLIPQLTKLSLANETFSKGNYLNGAKPMTNTTWTVAGMVAQTSGIPLNIPIDGNSYGEYSEFLPGVTSLGEILKDNGYNQMIMMGSDASFGGRRNYFTQHGDYTIYDLYTAKDNRKIDDSYFVWWGFEDQKLFEYAKDELAGLANSGKPFNFTMLTADTHFPDGYVCEHCGNAFDSQIENVIACSDKQIGAFVDWIKAQDFYEDTVVIIAGDHNNMSTTIPNLYNDDSYERSSFFTVINSDTDRLLPDEDRVYTTMDIFPTTLASLGCKIDGNRLGLGTNLYSDRKTLAEILGTEELSSELGRRSEFYNDNILNIK